MGRKNDNDKGGKDVLISVTDLYSIEKNTQTAAEEFAERYISVPKFTEHTKVMDQAQLRDAMGLRATFEYGDPWPQAENLLLQKGFRWHNLGGMRVMYVQEREDSVPDDGWNDGEEIADENINN